MSALISLEGISGVGKTTHSKLLIDWLEKKNTPAILVSEPSNTEFGLRLRSTILEYHSKWNKETAKLEALLFATDRFIQYTTQCKPALEQGKIVISDRSLYSSYAYQQARGLNFEGVKKVNQFSPKPDLAIVLDATPEVARRRIDDETKTEFDNIFDRIDILEKARNNYLQIAEKNSDKIEVVNTEAPIEEIQQKIRKYISPLLEK